MPKMNSKILREKIQRIFGSEDCYEIFCALNRNEHGPCRPEEPWYKYHQPLFKFEEDYLEQHLDDAPFWMKTDFLMSSLPLGAIGEPEDWTIELEDQTSREYSYDDCDNILIRKRWRLNRLPRRDGKSNEARWREYAELGWPKSEGCSYRLVTPEEDVEIQKRLKQTGLARPGSNVPVVGFSLDKLIASNIEQPEWIIDRMLRAAGALMVYGPSGVGKSFLTYALALMSATGKSFQLKDSQGNTLLSAGQHGGKKVCLVDGEMVAGDIAERMSQLIKGMGLKPVVGKSNFKPINPEDFKQAIATQEIAERAIAEANPELDHSVGWEPEVVEVAVEKLEEAWRTHSVVLEGNEEGVEIDLSNIIVYPRTAQDYRASMVSLVDEGSKSPIIEYALRNKIDVMIFDNVSTLSEGLSDENSSASFEPLNSLVVALKRHGVATVLVHHTGKAKEAKSFRGSSNLATVLEQSIRLEAVEGPKEGARFRVVVDKNRNLEGLYIDGKTLVLKDGAWDVEEDAYDNAARIVEAIKTRRFKSQQEIATHLKLGQSTVSKALSYAVTVGLVKDVEWKLWFKEAKELALGNSGFAVSEELETLDI